MLKQTFYSNGKLLLTGEYVVLDGASAIAIPTKYGQSLEIVPSEKAGIHWKSLDENDAVWFEGNFTSEKGQLKQLDKDKTSKILHNILLSAQQLNPNFLQEANGWNLTTRLDFPRNWGLGTSSTLINNIAQWAQVDAFVLLRKSFGGSGYDIAAAQSDSPIFYRLQDGIPIIKRVTSPWDFKDQLFFVHLNRKQDSKEGIVRYKNASVDTKMFTEIDDINKKLLVYTALSEFEALLDQHEQLISELIQLPTIKKERFSDYPRTIKSLGAWGGDFVLATGGEAEKDYFRDKGYSTIIDFRTMLK